MACPVRSLTERVRSIPKAVMPTPAMYTFLLTALTAKVAALHAIAHPGFATATRTPDTAGPDDRPDVYVKRLDDSVAGIAIADAAAHAISTRRQPSRNENCASIS